MGRKRKPRALRMDTDVRIPMTADQKQLLLDAVADEPAGFAAWAREILLKAAQKKLAKK